MIIKMSSLFRKPSPSFYMLKDSIKENKFKTVFMLVNDFFQAVLEGVVLFLTFSLIKVLQTGQINFDQAYLRKAVFEFLDLSTRSIIIVLLSLIAVTVVVQSILKYLSSVASIRIAANIGQRVVNEIALLISRSDYLKLQGMRAGNVVTVCQESPNALRLQFELYAGLIIASLYLCVYIYVLAVYSINEFLVSIVCISAIGIFQYFISVQTKKWSTVLVSNMSSVNNIMADLVGGFKFLKASSSMNLFMNKVNISTKNLKHSFLKSGYFSDLSNPLGRGLGMIVISVTALMFVFSSDNYEAVLPRLAVFIVTLQRLIGKSNEIFSLVKDFAQNRGRLLLYDQFVGAFSSKNKTPISSFPSRTSSFERNASAIKKNDFTHIRIEFDNVSFRYPVSERDSLSFISAVFNNGDIIALSGQSGSGKSTFIDVLTGLLFPSSGDLKVNGFSASQATSARTYLDSNISLVDQDCFVCHGTIRENIVWACETYNQQRLLWSLKMVNLESFVKGLPDGIDTIIGEGGLKMSGGQLQRICIARALYQKKDILILDEATSSLDKYNEREILNNIMSEYSSKVVIMITHNLENLRFANKCFYFDHGKIVASGNFSSISSYIKIHSVPSE